jgi:hypothetical protein
LNSTEAGLPEGNAADPRHPTVRKPPTPFPTLIVDAPERWQWPVPPIAWRHVPAPSNDVPQPCRLERKSGSTIEGDMLGFDPQARMLTFRTTLDGPRVELAFSRFCRLTLTTPLKPAPRMVNAPIERVPAAAQERDYTLHSDDVTPPLTGRTAGHVETSDGVYLFTPVNEEAALQRVFVPRTAYTRREFGPSAEEVATSRWIASPNDLLEALERQQKKPILPLGYSLLELGLLTHDQLYRALGGQPANVPLGEMLVGAGMITKADLRTALAHKMGYPLVDLNRYPVDPDAIARLPHRLAVMYRAMPLLLHEGKLIVAVDKPSRAVKLQELQALAGLAVVPVLAPRAQIALALERLSKDVWTHVAPLGMGFFETTA